MAQDRFLIAPLNSGLQQNVRPWLLPDDAYAQLYNAYVWRGRLKKRFGAIPTATKSVGISNLEQILQSRFRLNIGVTDAGTGNFVGSSSAEVTPAVGQMFSIGTTVFTVSVTGTPTVLLTTGTATGTYNTTTRAVTITGNNENPLTTVYYYPALPVTGFANLQDPEINFEPCIGFDTRYAYKFTGNQWIRQSNGTSTWTGTSADLFWWTNYRGENNQDTILFVSNFIAADGIRYFDGTSSTWATLQPQVSTTEYMWTARIVLPFKDVLVALNTKESALVGGAVSYVNRARWSQNGTPLTTGDPNSWRDDIAGRGSYLDAPTKEAIISALILKDRLIVYFESSTWELVYTGNNIQPFRWQQINIELGCESTFSIVPFDKVLLGIGNVGIHACNGANVERMDELIPDEIFDIHNAEEGVQRVYGIRDYYTELVYWSLPNSGFNVTKYNNSVLVYNYRTGSWAKNDDSITAFGYFQKLDTESDEWREANMTWQQNNDTWGDIPSQKRFRSIVAGNQQGFTFLIEPDESTNSPALQITNMTQVGDFVVLDVIDNNLLEFGRDLPTTFIQINNAVGKTGVGGALATLQITDEYSTRDVNGNNFKATFLTNTQIYIPGTLTNTYAGAGTITRVSMINILTKEYNFYVSQGMNAYVDRIDFQVDKVAPKIVDGVRVSQGEITIDYQVSTSAESMIQQGEATDALLGTSVLDLSPYELVPFEDQASRLWHPVYMQADGEFIQLHIYFNDDQMYDVFKASAPFTLHAMCIHAQPAALRLQ